MDKPIILEIKETEDNFIKLINDSNLPAFFLIRIIEKLYKELQPLEQNEISKVKEQYSLKFKEEKSKKG